MPNISLNLRTPLTLAALMAVSGAAASQTINPALVASRTSGPAPLAVMFDAVGTTSTNVPDAFRQVLYTFSFGDSGAGTYTLTDGASKNVESGGPLAWHVFETPGTYLVTLVANDGTSSAQKTVTITVQDPNVVYAGAATVCIDPAGTTGWGPSGATYATAIPDVSTWSNKRLMLKRGSDFTSAGEFWVANASTNFQVVAGGTGAKPKVQAIRVGAGRPPADATVWPDYCTFVDLYCVNGLYLGGYGSHQLGLRCDIDPTCQQMGFGWNVYNMFSDPYQQLPIGNWPVPKYHLLADCSFPGNQTNAWYNIYCDAAHSAGILGCYFDQVVYHNVRVVESQKAFIAHNNLRANSLSTSYHALKMHGGSLTAYAEPLTLTNGSWSSRYGVVQNNQFGSPSCQYPWLTAFTPENGLDQGQEGVEDFLVLNNTFTRSLQGQLDVVVGGRRISAIGNTVVGGTFTMQTGHDEALPAEWKGPYYTSRA